MKRYAILLFMSLVPLWLMSQNYDKLWQEAEQAADKDLPKTEQKVLRRIADKALRNKDYGQMLAAELRYSSLAVAISPDSLDPEIARLSTLHTQSANNAPLQSILSVVLGNIYSANKGLGDDHEQVSKDYYDQALANMDALAGHRDGEYSPFVNREDDSEVFGHDLLHVVGMEIGRYKELRDYYLAHGNRRAACVMELEMARNDKTLIRTTLLEHYDSLITVYSDVPEVADLAIERFEEMPSYYDKEQEAKYEYGEKIVAQWPEWRKMNLVRNGLSSLTAPKFHIYLKDNCVLPDTPTKLEMTGLRNIGSINVTLRRLDADGSMDLSVGSEENYKKVAKLIRANEQPIILSRRYAQQEDYKLFGDTLELPGLPVGVYLVEAMADKVGFKPQRAVLYVSGLYLMAEQLPDKQIRYVTLDAATGHPVAGANVKLEFYKGYYTAEQKTLLTTDSNGEAICKYIKGKPASAFAYTATDKSLPKSSVSGSYNYSDYYEGGEKISVFTDRSIYRPGQTVMASAIVFDQTGKTEHRAVADKKIRFILRDANYNVVGTKESTTDEFGTASTEFQLPTAGLTGNFTLTIDGLRRSSTTLRVEEYKRPTFFIEFDDYKDVYHAGDTIEVKGRAKSYAGVPVQGAHVSYEVTRSNSEWWWHRSSDDKKQVEKAEVSTDEKGEFCMRVPLVLPKGNERKAFYTFTAKATVTDLAGESHSGNTHIPLGTRTKVLSCDLPKNELDEKLTSITFSLRNASGNEVDGTVSYSFDGGKPQTAKANTSIKLPRLFKSGTHELLATCEGDTIKQSFNIHSFADKRPSSATHEWFYCEDSTFPTNGKPVRIQIGSSDADQYILYTVFAEGKELDHGFIKQSNALTTQPFTYREEYGDGITVSYAWVKDKIFYHHSATIKKPLPNKQLKVAWRTFRDRLTPGQQEQWTAIVTTPDGKPANAQMMAVLFDKSLDDIAYHSWFFNPSLYRNVPNTMWQGLYSSSITLSYTVAHASKDYHHTTYSSFERDYYDRLCFFLQLDLIPLRAALGSSNVKFKERQANGNVVMLEAMTERTPTMDTVNAATQTKEDNSQENNSGSNTTQVRENLNETAFFLPQLNADANGIVTMSFTLPESITTWRFMGLAHDKQMLNGRLSGEAVASKTVMVQPNMPRFIRQHDEATIASKLINTSEKAVSGTAYIDILEPSTEAVLHTASQPFAIEAGNTSQVSFPVDATKLPQLVIVRMRASGDGYSDGEQHYLPILPDQEMVLNTVPFTQHEAGVKTIDVARMFPETASQRKLTVEYTNNPAWLMVQALPYVGDYQAYDALSLAAALYANSIGRNIITSSPQIKRVIEQWQRETGTETSLLSNLQKNTQLKELMLDETPWMLDAKNETDQKQSLIRFFDSNQLNQKLSTAAEKLRKLQQEDGSWSWCNGMKGSPYMTGSILTTLVRLNNMIGKQSETEDMITRAFGFMNKHIDEEVKHLKKVQKDKKSTPRPSELAVEYLYALAIGKPNLSPTAKANRDYLVSLLTKQTTAYTIYGKAVAAVIFAANGNTKKAKEYLQSIEEYSVYTDEMGRYFDTRKAGYSWFNYRIPTEVAAIEAYKFISPDNRKPIEEMQRWLLQSKRTQVWDTPLNSINAIYAFAENSKIEALEIKGGETVLKLDGQPIETTAATAGLGYVKAAIDNPTASVFTAEKTTPMTSWGAVYAQFMQPMTDISQANSGITVTREYITADGKASADGEISLKVGQKVRVRLTIVADRDYDFVHVIDKRAACLEPVSQLSGYHWGYYIAPKDYTTTYYFDRMRKGRHQVEAEYYVDRAGTYRSGTCTAQCAYATEYTGRAKAVVFKVE